MIGGLMKTSSRFAIIAAAGILAGGVSSAQAGGLGGDCCADLEERVAELEATTVRKGNRKVSLKLSGQVNRSILWFDDGFEDNTYSVDNSNTSSRFRLTGSVGVLPGLTAGYKMEFDVETARSGSVDQVNDDRPGNTGTGGDGGLQVRVAEWYLKSATLGKLTVGQGSPATDDLTKINLGGSAIATKDGSVMDTGGSFFIRRSNGALLGTRVGVFAPGIDTARMDRVRYDTPTIAGFTMSAAWGEDDFWDAALRYAGEFGGIRVAGGIGYSEDHDEDGALSAGANEDISVYKGSISAWAPGLMGVGPYFTASFVHREFDGTAASNNGVNGGNRPDFDFWRVEGGIRQNFTGLGDTIAYIEYADAEGGVEDLAIVGLSADLTKSDMTMFGLGVVQRINPAAMELFVSYRNYEFDAADATGNLQLEDLQLVHAGARIQF